jgi:ketosteroid isomerase-like protein
MSQESIEVVQAFVDAFNQGDWEVALDHMDSDFEFDASRAISDLRSVFTLDQVRAAMDDFFGLWEAVRVEVDKFAEAGEQVAVSFTNYHRGRDGIELKVRPSAVWTIRNGRIVHGCLYQEWEDALDAVGLSE